MRHLKKVILIFIFFKLTIALVTLLIENSPFQLFQFEQIATDDIELNDIYYSTREFKGIDFNSKDVVLVNTGSLENGIYFRKNLADIIEIIASKKPNIIGLDIFFSENKNPIYDSVLKNTIIQNDIVTALDANNIDGNIFLSDKKGIINFPEHSNKTIRDYYNFKIVNNDTISSFAAVLAKTKSKDSVNYLKYSSDRIGYYNILNENQQISPLNFPAIEASDIFKIVFEERLNEILKNKVVIIGHLGNGFMHNPYDIEDKFRVPMDKSLFNRDLTTPGAIIHANAVQMMLNNDRIISVEGWSYEIISSIILLIYLNIFLYINDKFSLSKLISLFIIMITSLPLIYLACIYLMDIGIYFKVGVLFGLVIILEEFIEVYDWSIEKFTTKNKKNA